MFESIQGQDDAIEALQKALMRPVHSYAFFGSRGTYIEQAARIFAAHLIDETGASDDRALKRIHPDVVEFEPSAVTYKVKEDVREGMLSELRKSPIEAKSKVIIIHDAHLLRADSANAMLKSLEEPPVNAHWILIAPSVDSVLSTIRSRCYAVHFARLTNDIIEAQLVSEGVEQNRAKEISFACSGRLDRAQKLATYFMPLQECVREVVRTLDGSASSTARNAQHIVESFDEISSDVTATHKKELETLKKSMKDSGYTDKIASSIMSSAKAKYEAQEKKLRREIVTEFLDLLAMALIRNDAGYSGDQLFVIHVDETISEYRKRLVYNPAEQLFLESLLASISSQKQSKLVNS